MPDQDEFSQYLTPPAKEPVAEEPDYENMPTEEVLSLAAKNLLPSAKNAIVAIPSAIYHYEDTGQALKQIGEGAVSKAKGALGYEQKPEEKTKNEALFNAMVEPFTSVAGFKKALATDPFSVLTTAAIPLTGGASGAEAAAAKLGQIGSAGSKLAAVGEKAANVAAKGLTAASYAVDPVKSTLGAAGALTDYASKATKLGAAASSGVPAYSLERAYGAGSSANPAIKQAFNTFAVGAGDPVAFSQRASKAVDALKSEASADWLNSRGALTGANKTDIDFKPIYDAIDQGRDLVGKNVYPSNQAAHQALDTIYLEAIYRESMPSGSPERTLEGFDAWKRLVQQQINQMPHSASVDKQAVQGVHAGIKKAIDSVSPEYQELMDQWSSVKDNLQNIASLGTNSRTAANNELARFMKAQKTPQGQQLIEQLAEKDPLIPYMVAGSTLHSAGANGISGLVEKVSAPFHIYNLGHQLVNGDWKGLLAATGMAAGQGIVQSPRLMGKAAYGLGSVAGSLPGRAVGAASKELPTFASGTAPAIINLEKAEKKEDPYASFLESPTEPTPRKAGGSVGRIRRASGGKVGMDVKPLVDRLMSLADQAKKATDNNTKPLLNAPDETIVKALRVANQAI